MDVYWGQVARAYAKRAYIEWFLHGWGIEDFGGLEAVCLFNNWHGEDSARTRECQLREFRERLGSLGAMEVAYAEFPKRNNEGTCSYAIVIKPAPQTIDIIEAAYEDVVGTCGRNPKRSLN